MNIPIYIKNKRSRIQGKSKQTGFSLIEIMVSALILSVGVLGVASLQVVGLKGTQQSYTKQQAMSVVQNLTERMRSNKEGVLEGHYELGTAVGFCTTANPPDCTNNCSAEGMADADLHNLVCGYQSDGGARTGAIVNLDATDISTFVGGDLSIACDPAGDCSNGNIRIEVNWQERAIGTEQADVQDSLIFNTNISL